MQRKIALKIIYKTIEDSSYTNLLMRTELDKLKPIQRPFVTNLVNGVLKNYYYLEYQHLDLYKKTNLKNTIILSMAVYEKFFLNEKDYVVFNEYVDLGESKFDKKFLNAVLHNIKELREPNKYYIKYSLPEWIYNLLSKQYSNDELKKILENYSRVPSVYYHINSNKADFNKLKELEIENIDNKIYTSKHNLINTNEFKEGYFYIQDINASKLVDELCLNENDIFLDACSAPGSKLFNALEIVKPENAYANDINEKRVGLIKERAENLGYLNVNYSCIDSCKLHEYFDKKFDKILLDVPCSGLGVIGRRNDIKFHITPNSLDELQVIQSQILESASKIIKNNGQILYSTCTLNKKENDKQIDSFLSKHTDFRLIRKKTIINLDGDLFFLALIKKV